MGCCRGMEWDIGVDGIEYCGIEYCGMEYCGVEYCCGMEWNVATSDQFWRA